MTTPAQSALIALVPTAVLVDGVRTVIQPGQPLPALSASDSLALQHGKAAQPAATVATVANPPVYGAAHAPQAAEAPDAPEVQDTPEAPDAQPAPSAAPAPPIATTTKPVKTTQAPAKAKE